MKSDRKKVIARVGRLANSIEFEGFIISFTLTSELPRVMLPPDSGASYAND
jgi:hypothetical protein